MQKKLIFFLITLMAFPLIAFAADWTSSGDNIYYDAGNVGIGTSSPNADLHVDGSLKLSSDGTSMYIKPNITVGDITAHYIGTNAEGDGVLPFIFRNGGANRVIFETTGEVGIGNMSPDARLDVYSYNKGLMVNQYYYLVDGDDAFDPDYPTITANRDSSYRGATIAIGNNAGQYYLHARNDVFKLFNPSEEELYRILPDGKMGLGTTSPTSRLHVFAESPAKIAQYHSAGTDFAPSSPTLIVKRESPNYGATISIGNQADDFYLFADQDNLKFYSPSETSVQTISSAGNVGIGTETPGEKLEVDGNIKLSGNIVSDGDICIGNCSQ